MNGAIRYVCVLLILLGGSRKVYAQFGRNLINETFGEGKTNPGPSITPSKTNFRYTTDSCPSPGYYTVTNSLYGCPSYRMGGSIDHTPTDDYGYLMIVSDTVSTVSKFLYIDTLTEPLCAGTVYQLSAYFLNIEVPGYCSTSDEHFPSFTFAVETTTGAVLGEANTGELGYDFTSGTVKYHSYGVTFTMPAGVDGVVLKIKDDPSGYTPCGYAFAVDDIRFTAVGPPATAMFDGGMENESIKAVCFQDNKTVGMTGSVAPGFTDVALQWQQSSDNGATWTDIPGATSAHYSRSFAVADTILFRMRASEREKINNSNCSVVTNVLTMEVDDIPQHYTISSNSPACSGSNLQLDADGGAGYVWTGPNGFYDNVSYAHIYYCTRADSGTYYVQIRSLGGCVRTDSVHVMIIGSLTGGSLGADLPVCKGRAVPLQASGGRAYLWSPAAGLSNVSVYNPLASPDVSTKYTVAITDSLGCSANQFITVNVLNKIAVRAGISGAQVLCQPADSATFTDGSQGAITGWHWKFGNGSVSALQNPPLQHYTTINSTGYTVILAVADSVGCADTAYHFVKVVNNCFITVPSAFTPNGDGVNDYLYPLNAYKATELSFRVFSRYGQLLFASHDWQKKWDGRRNGLPLPAGVYVWQLNYTDALHQKIASHGSALLIR
ncbi:MAG: gliding motility-associated C-terminal domain-containing protein [Williamsia sp.]|nr:gliding motility-associated C-terminal domain-containing protein [Williamsia sp.]